MERGLCCYEQNINLIGLWLRFEVFQLDEDDEVEYIFTKMDHVQIHIIILTDSSNGHNTIMSEQRTLQAANLA